MLAMLERSQGRHELAKRRHVEPADLGTQTLIMYPAEPARLDVFSQFPLPAGVMPRRHKSMESTDIMLEMVAAGRGDFVDPANA